MPSSTRQTRSGLALIALMVGLVASPTLPSRAGDEPAAAGATEDRSEGEAKPENEAEKDGPLDPFFDLIDPAKLQRGLDRALDDLFDGRLPGSLVRPEVPEIGEPVFFDLTRPLGAQKYSNELNYLLNSSTRTAPTLQVIEYEYAFDNWKAVEFDLSYYNDRLEVLTPFYQRTLAVGAQGRSVHGYQLSTDLYLRSGFIGGSAVYTYGWKPSKESRFSTLSFVGVNRMLIGGFLAQTPRPGTSPMLVTSPHSTANPAGDGRIYGAYRPTFNIDFFYKLSESIALGYENDLFFGHGRDGEYFSFPFVTWEAGQHAFFQVGGGYYHFESKDQFTFMLHLNFVNPSVKVEKQKDRNETAENAEPDAAEPTRAGRLAQWWHDRRSIR